MSYTQKEARILIDFHRKYSQPRENHYLRYLSILEEQAPDITCDIEQAYCDYDAPEYAGEESEARARAIGMITGWIDTLDQIRERLKG